jgi:hypothetical protein
MAPRELQLDPDPSRGLCEESGGSSPSPAAFQAFAAGRRLDEVDNVLLAAAACELHPNAILKGIETKSVKETLKRATDEAVELGSKHPQSRWAAALLGRRPP